MAGFRCETFVVGNRSGAELVLFLEPEGDAIVLPPGARCQVAADHDGPDILDLEVEYDVGRITMYASCRKRVVVDGVRVR